ncbi:MAG: ribosome maturation factor RimP [Pseudomonadota bacterium]
MADAALKALLEPVVETAGFELVRLRVTGSRDRTLQIMAERPNGTMSAEDCAALSRALSPVLEEKDPITEAYTLEVSSPGIDRPLTRLKDFARWDGFAAKIELTYAVEGQKRFKGILAGTEDQNVLIDLEGEEETAMMPFDIIAAAKLIMTDELITESLRRSKSALKEGDAEWSENADGPQRGGMS